MAAWESPGRDLWKQEDTSQPLPISQNPKYLSSTIIPSMNIAASIGRQPNSVTHMQKWHKRQLFVKKRTAERQKLSTVGVKISANIFEQFDCSSISSNSPRKCNSLCKILSRWTLSLSVTKECRSDGYNHLYVINVSAVMKHVFPHENKCTHVCISQCFQNL